MSNLPGGYAVGVRRRPSDSTDACANPACGKSLAGRATNAKYCSTPCKEVRQYELKKERSRSISVTAGSYAVLNAEAAKRGVTVCRLVEDLIAKAIDEGQH